MGFYPGEPEVGRIVEALLGAAKRGATVSLIVDAYDYLIDDTKQEFGSLFWHATLPAKLRLNEESHRQSLQRLRQAGVACVVTNMPKRAFTSPFSGRSHIKTTIVDDYLYIGGCNLHRPKEIDLMVGWKNHAAADWLYVQMQKIAANPFTQTVLGPEDQTYTVNNDTQLLLDSGVKHQSLIMENALEVIDNADDWVVLTTQFFPDKAVKHLVAALNRGVKVYLIFNHYQQFSGVNLFVQYMRGRGAQVWRPRGLFAYELSKDLPFLHAKVLATEKEVMIGSHNYLQIGVNFGTAELSLRQKDPSFAREVAEAIITQCQLDDAITLPR
jgi:phosphatidylserine/phosphatidylglycerophosphate/cardiolipin synthase-like enzyme